MCVFIAGTAAIHSLAHRVVAVRPFGTTPIYI